MSNIKFRFDVWKSYVNKIGEMLLNDNYLISVYFKKDKSNYKKFKDLYENNFIKYKTNERFTIPIIGKISSGKSTFLNSILQGNYLSSSSNIETKFICILRNNSNSKSPTLYKSKMKEEQLDYKYKNFKYFYFEKTEEMKGDILENIKKINDYLSFYEKKIINISERDINNYFYILELNIPFFNENEEISNYFELMDIPGLNEKDDFYLKEIIPLIINKCLFSIYIFDLGCYENQDTSKIYQDYSKQLNKFYNANSIYILNKIDSITEEDKKNCKNEDYYFKKFKNYLSDKEKNFNVDLSNNYFLKLNSLELFNKVNAFSDLKTYISHIIDTIKMETDENFSIKDYLKEQYIKYFQITDKEIKEIFDNSNNDQYKDYFDEKEFDVILDYINSKGFTADFEEEDYQKFKYIFVNKNKINLPVPELNDIYKTIIGSMNKSLDDFLKWDHVTKLMETFKESINKIFENEDEKRKYTEICDNLLKSFLEELEKKSKLEKIEWKVSIMDSLKYILDSLINLENNNKSLEKLKDDFNSLTYFIYNYRKIRIPILGGYSTGKSTFLNSMIGKDILPVDINRCTNRGIILRHNRNKNKPPQLFQTKFIKVENPDYWYFKDEKEPICEGYEEVKKKLIELNSQDAEFENAFVLLKIHLNIFSELDFSHDKVLEEDLKDKLELIDFPGLNVDNNFYHEKIFSPLMRFSDGFIFMNECDLIQEFGNMKILTSIIEQIKVRKFTFTYKSCLFLLHKLDKSLDLDINKSKEIFENLFIKDTNEKEELKVDKFSSKLYHIYIDFYNKFTTDFKSFLKYIAGNLIKPEEKKSIKNYRDFLNKINNISKRLKFQINKKLIKNNNEKIEEDSLLSEEKINNNIFEVYRTIKPELINEKKIEISENIKIIKEIYSNYSYLKGNHKIQNQRILSNANSLFESLYNLFKDSYDYTDKEFKKYLNYFIDNFNDIFIFIDLKLFGTQFNNQIIYNTNEKEINNIKKELQDFYEGTKEFIDDKKNEFEEKNQKLKDEFISKYDENSLKNFEQLEKNIQKNIYEFSKCLDNQYDKLNKIAKKVKIAYKKGKYFNINISKISLNKNSNISELYEYKENPFANIFKGIGNIFISIHNWINEKKQIENNIDKYLLEINNLIDNCKITYEDEIESIKKEILKKIDGYTEINNSTFDGIKENRKEYEKIKKEYYQIINNNN